MKSGRCPARRPACSSNSRPRSEEDRPVIERAGARRGGTAATSSCRRDSATIAAEQACALEDPAGHVPLGRRRPPARHGRHHRGRRLPRRAACRRGHRPARAVRRATATTMRSCSATRRTATCTSCYASRSTTTSRWRATPGSWTTSSAWSSSKYDGALKAEHGTGRNMAPFVETEWGPDAYAVMQRLKALARPRRPPESRRHHLRRPAGAPRPSQDAARGRWRNRQVHRVRLLRAAVPQPRPHPDAAPAHRRPAGARAPGDRTATVTRRAPSRWISRTRPSTPAPSTACAPPPARSASTPVSSRSGCADRATVRSADGQRSGWPPTSGRSKPSVRVALGAGKLASSVGGARVLARHHAAPAAARHAHADVAAARCRGPRASSRNRPRHRTARPPSTSRRAFRGRWGTCPESTTELSLVDALGSVASRAGQAGVGPSRRCGPLLRRAVLVEGLRRRPRDRGQPHHRALLGVVRRGRLPVVVDTSPCTYGLRTCRPALTPREPGAVRPPDDPRLARVRGRAAAAAARREAAPRFGRPAPCLLGHEDEPRRRGSSECPPRARIAWSLPLDAGCCGFAGDRGWLVPELTASATLPEAREAVEARADGYYSSSRTCEIGMTRATGHVYRSYVYLLEWATRP